MKIRFYLKRELSKVDTAIYANISYGIGEPLKYYINESINPVHWNKKDCRAREYKKFPEYPEFNMRLVGIEATIKTEIRSYQRHSDNALPGKEKLKELLDIAFKRDKAPKSDYNLISYFRELIRQSVEGERVHPRTGKRISAGTIKYYNTARERLEKFAKQYKRSLLFENIDKDFHRAFTKYLESDLELSFNTIGKQITTVKLIMNEAVKNRVTTFAGHRTDGFAAYSEDTKPVYLNKDELKELANLDLSNSPTYDNVRDWFLIACYTGLRYSDYRQFNPAKIHRSMIDIMPTKTKQEIAIPIHREVKQIIQKYNGKLPAPISNQKMNDYLKIIGARVDLLKQVITRTFTKAGKEVVQQQPKYEFLGTHTARRSFATNEYLAGTPILTIMAITGHKTERAFLRYIRVTPQEHARLMAARWDNEKVG